ncbi:MAG: hypothetical protein E7J47_07050, partial [Clostridium perfringens]|nr:hypothetical protein [Clostridium perfringens]
TNIVLEEMNLNDDGKVELKEDKTLEIKWSGNDTRDYEANQGMKDANGLNKERDSNRIEKNDKSYSYSYT